MAPRRTTYAGGLVRAVNIPSVDFPQYKEQAQFSSDINRRLDMIKNFAVDRGKEEAMVSAEEFAYSPENPMTIDAFLSPKLDAEQRQEIMGDRFGNAYERKLYDTNQSILKTKFTQLGKILIDDEYQEALQANTPLDTFYSNTDGQIDSMLESVLEVSPILYAELRSDLRSQAYEKYLALGEEQNKLEKTVNAENIKLIVNNTDPSLGRLLTGQVNSVAELKTILEAELRQDMLSTNLSPSERDDLVKKQNEKLEAVISSIFNNAVDFATMTPGKEDDLLLAFETGDWSAFADPENPYQTENLEFHYLNKIMDALSVEEKSQYIKKAKEVQQDKQALALKLQETETANINSEISQIKTAMITENLTDNFSYADQSAMAWTPITREAIVSGEGVTYINGKAYTYPELEDRLRQLDPDKANTFLKENTLATYTTPGAADWLKNKISNIAYDKYIPNSKMDDLSDAMVANGGILTEDMWDEVTQGVLGDFPIALFPDGEFSIGIGTSAYGDILSEIQSYNNSFLTNLKLEIATIIDSPEIVRYISQGETMNISEDFFRSIKGGDEYDQVFDNREGKLFLDTERELRRVLQESEAEATPLSKDQIVNVIIPGILRYNIQQSKKITLNNLSTQFDFRDNNSRKVDRDGTVYAVFKFPDSKAPIEIPYAINDEDPVIALESTKQMLKVITRYRNDDRYKAKFGSAEAREFFDITDLLSFENELSEHARLLEIEVNSQESKFDWRGQLNGNGQ